MTETWTCGHCGASITVAERIGTSCTYFDYCPSCGREHPEHTIEKEQ